MTPPFGLDVGERWSEGGLELQAGIRKFHQGRWHPPCDSFVDEPEDSLQVEQEPVVEDLGIHQSEHVGQQHPEREHVALLEVDAETALPKPSEHQLLGAQQGQLFGRVVAESFPTSHSPQEREVEVALLNYSPAELEFSFSGDHYAAAASEVVEHALASQRGVPLTAGLYEVPHLLLPKGCFPLGSVLEQILQIIIVVLPVGHHCILELQLLTVAILNLDIAVKAYEMPVLLVLHTHHGWVYFMLSTP